MKNKRLHRSINFSGGICSWFAARRTVERHGAENCSLIFADTNFEDADLYRFLDDAANDLGLPLIRIADGRTPWDVFFDNRFLGNSRIDLCSRILKRELLAKWHSENCDPTNTRIIVGLGYGEKDRYLRFRSRMRSRGWKTEAPAMAPPYATKADMIVALRDRGIELPALYEEGFPHNNCGGFCVKAGQAHFRLLLQKRRQFYLENEEREQEFIKMIGKKVSILKDRRGGTTKPMTLREFRERIECGDITQTADWGGCGCAID